VPDPEVYFCPYCGESAPNNEWWTQQQLEQAKGEIAGPAMQMLVDELQKGMSSSRSKGLRFKAGKVDAPPPPPPLTEPNDMIMVEPPCHPWEPLKVDDEWGDPLHCLICGCDFAI
jgi:hypothetical protein